MKYAIIERKRYGQCDELVFYRFVDECVVQLITEYTSELNQPPVLNRHIFNSKKLCRKYRGCFFQCQLSIEISTPEKKRFFLIKSSMWRYNFAPYLTWFLQAYKTPALPWRLNLNTARKTEPHKTAGIFFFTNKISESFAYPFIQTIRFAHW